MKTLRITMIALLFVSAIAAQDIRMDEVPSEVIAKFQEQYPNATEVEWEKEGDGYEVEFEMDGEEYEIEYTADGMREADYEQDISVDDLPEAIRSVIADSYAGYEIDSIEKVVNDGSTTYEIELEKGWNDEIDLVFDQMGNILEKDD